MTESAESLEIQLAEAKRWLSGECDRLRAERDEARSQLGAAEARIEAVRRLHFPYDCTEAGESGHETCGEREWCYSCGESQPWPCTTFQALRDGD
jgi:hypothetical protein